MNMQKIDLLYKAKETQLIRNNATVNNIQKIHSRL